MAATFWLLSGVILGPNLSRSGVSAGIFDFLNLGGLAGTSHNSRNPTVIDFTNQGLGLLNFLGNLRKDEAPDKQLKSRNHVNFLGIPGKQGVPDLPGLPNIPFLEGVPVVPGVVGSIPGVGACLPKGTPLVNPISPSFLQNFLRGIPGAQDVFRSLQRLPRVDPNRLLGKWHWVLITPSVHTRRCATSEYKGLAQINQTASAFGVVDSFREESPFGAPKIGFGYGLVNNQKISIYTQQDPCPYQVVAVGPQSSTASQYEYIVLSNWAKYPIIGLAKDVGTFYRDYMPELERTLRNENYMNFLTDAFRSVEFLDWSQCRQRFSSGNLVGNILNGILSFG